MLWLHHKNHPQQKKTILSLAELLPDFLLFMKAADEMNLKMLEGAIFPDDTAFASFKIEFSFRCLRKHAERERERKKKLFFLSSLRERGIVIHFS